MDSKVVFLICFHNEYEFKISIHSLPPPQKNLIDPKIPILKVNIKKGKQQLHLALHALQPGV